MPFITTADKTTLFYNDWGQGKPVVLIHGWPLQSDMWEYQAPVLAANGLRVIAYDRRGFGRSSQPWSGYDYDTLSDDLAAMMDQLDLHDATLVGFSMGGGEVARYLSRHGSARVSKAALIAAVTPYLLKTDDNPEGVDKSVFNEMQDGIAKDRAHFMAGFGKLFYGAGMFNFTVTAEIMEWSLMMALQGSMRATTECAKSFATTDFRPDMKAFTMPTLVVHGDADQTVPVSSAGRRTAKMIAGADYREYAGAPHALTFTHKDKLNEDLLAFIGR